MAGYYCKYVPPLGLRVVEYAGHLYAEEEVP